MRSTPTTAASTLRSSTSATTSPSRSGPGSGSAPITELDRINFGLTLEQTSIEPFDNSPQRFIDFVNQNGNEPQALITTTSWVRDRRDSALWPTSGTLQRATAEVTLPVLDLRYYKLGYQVGWYYPLTRDFTLFLNGELGYGDGYDGKQLPFYKSFYAGGASSVRRYEQSSLGPRDINGVLGGCRKVVGNAELLFPVPGLGQDRSARLGLFFDVGQVWLAQSPYTLSDLQLRYSTGIVFAWNSPFGPFKLSIAQPINDQPNEPDSEIPVRVRPDVLSAKRCDAMRSGVPHRRGRRRK